MSLLADTPSEYAFDADRRQVGVRFSHKNVQSVLNFFPDMACLCDSGGILMMNEGGVRLLELDSADDVIGGRLDSFMMPEIAAIADDIIAQLLNETDPLPIKMRSAKGHQFSVNLSAQWARELGPNLIIVTAQDISTRVRLVEEIKRSEDRFRHLVDNSLDLLCACRDGRINFINKAGLDLLRADSRDQVIDLPVHEIFHPDYEDIFSEALGELCAEKRLFPTKLKCLDGTFIDVHVKVNLSNKSEPGGFMIEARDITEHRRAVMALYQSNVELEDRVLARTEELREEIERRRDAEKGLRHAATHDGLTGLPNRVFMVEALEKLVSSKREADSNFAVLFIDLDGFKAVNDEMGHESGDELLRQAADRLGGCIREYDTAARFGGDEFVVLLTNNDNRKIVENKAEQILTSIAAVYMLNDGREACVSASIGVAFYPGDGDTADKLLKKADEAMYDVKGSGKNNFKFAT